jgi:hypothetical protein
MSWLQTEIFAAFGITQAHSIVVVAPPANNDSTHRYFTFKSLLPAIVVC